MLNKTLVLLIHEKVLLAHGGANGIRDVNALESAINRPYQSFGGNDLYPTPIHKAAAICESIIMNHPFVDGNKRTGYVLMETILRLHNLVINENEDNLYQFVIDISTGTLRFDDIVIWLEGHTELK